MKTQGIKAAAIYGTMNPNVRREILKKYQRGQIDVVCNVDVLIEGFDAPNSSVCINLRPTFSPIVAEQRAGRTLRLDPNNPKKEAVIIDFFDKDSRRQPISFADVVDSAIIHSRTGSGSESPNGGGGQIPLPKISLDGCLVTTDVEEVMKIINERRKLNESTLIPNDFELLTLEMISELVGKERKSIWPVMKKLREEMPKEFIRSTMLGNPYYVSSKGRQILMERLTPKQGVKINRFELAEKFGLSPGQIYNHIQQVSDMYPASITRNGHDLITTSEIYEVLENTIKERVPPPDFQPVYLNNLIEGTTIGKKRFKSAINALRDQYPQHFFGGNNTVKPLYVSNEGEQLINSLIKGLTHPEHFVEFSFESFGDELNVDAYITNYYLDKLRKENPDEVTPKASGGIKVYISENGLTILKEMVQNRPRK